MKKPILIGSIFLLLSISALTLAQNSAFSEYLFKAVQADSGQTVETETDKAQQLVKTGTQDSQITDFPVQKSAKEPVSDEIAFELFFIHVVALDRAATKAEAKGKSGNLWRNYLSRRGFTESEVAAVRALANEFAGEVLPLHRKALGVIKNARASMARGGNLGQPPELAQMQQERNALAMRYKNKLRARLGSEVVEKAKRLIQENSNNLLDGSENLLTPEDRLNLRRQRQNNLPNRKENQQR